MGALITILQTLASAALAAAGRAAFKVAVAMLTERAFAELILTGLEALVKRTATGVDDKLVADARRALAPLLEGGKP